MAQVKIQEHIAQERARAKQETDEEVETGSVRGLRRLEPSIHNLQVLVYSTQLVSLSAFPLSYDFHKER